MTSYLSGFVVVVRDSRVNYCAITVCERVCLVWYRYRVVLRRVKPSQLASMYRRRFSKWNSSFSESQNGKSHLFLARFFLKFFKKYF